MLGRLYVNEVHGRRFGCAELSVEIPAIHGYDNAIQVTLILDNHHTMSFKSGHSTISRREKTHTVTLKTFGMAYWQYPLPRFSRCMHGQVLVV